MNQTEQTLADDLYAALNNYTDALPRTVQAAKFQVGISDLGFCSERTRRMIAEIPKADPEDNLKSFIGHAVGDWLERVALTVWPDAYTQSEVALVLAGDGGEYHVTGHPDLIRPDWGVIDVKGLALDTVIPTPSGWTTMGRLEIGDQVLDRSGQPCRVTTTSAVKEIDCWRITFRNGLSVVCDDEHRWAVLDDHGRQRTWTVGQIAAHRRIGRAVSIPIADTFDLPSVELPLDPWLLGYWLGNGSHSRPMLHANGDDAAEVVTAVNSAGYTTGHIHRDPRANTTEMYVTGIRKRFTDLGLLGHKHIPDSYLRAGTEQRRALLRGLMDSDGCWNTARRRVTFVNTNQALADGVAELARSLGERVQRYDGDRTGYGVTCHAWSVEWTPTFVPFALSHKADRVRLGKIKHHRHRIVSVERTLTVPTRCIAVDSPTRTYLCTEAMIPTHNTDYGLDVIERTGPTLQQMFQRHCYARAAYEAGLFTIPLSQVKTANVWLDRSGQQQRLHAHVDDYDPWIVAQAAAWLDDVVYAHAYHHEARKEPPREMCAKVCGHFSTCRALDTDATGLLTDDSVLAAVDVIRDARRMIREAERMKRAASAKLTGITGTTGKFSVRWVWVNESDVAYHRDGYYKLDVREM